MTNHSRFSASGATRYLNCTKSIEMEDGIEDAPSKYALEGTLAHEYAEKLLFVPEDKINPLLYDNEDMLEAAKTYRDTILLILHYTNNFRVKLEQKIKLDFIDPELYGTADCIIEDYQNKVLHVIDFKYGKTKVDPNCDQLKYYACGAIYKKPFDEVQLIIVQPRLRNKTIDKVRSHKTDKKELSEWAFNLANTVKKIKSGDTEFKEGQWCFFCKGKTICPEYQNKTLKQAKKEFSVIE